MKTKDMLYIQRVGNPTGLKDRNGTSISVGDTVEFYFDGTDYGAISPPDKYKPSDYDGVNATKMTDRVIEIDGEFYFYCEETGGGAFAYRHNEHCTVVPIIDNATITK